MVASFQGEYRFLSNFYPCQIVGWYGLAYSSAEAMYQAAKCLSYQGGIVLKADPWALPQVEKRIREAPTPGMAKRIGTAQAKPLPAHWEVPSPPYGEPLKVSLMRAVQEAKYGQNDSLLRALLSTGDEELQEGNSWGDAFWGVSSGIGLNWMGRILMELRDNHRYDG